MNLPDPSISNVRRAVQGVTLLELLIVIGLIGMLGAVTSPFLSQFLNRNNLTLTTNVVTASLRKAQTYAMSGREDTEWGVCMVGSILRMYAGTCASPTVSEERTIPDTISVDNLTDITFSKGRGEPLNSVAISISNTTNTNTVNVNMAGTIEVD